MIVRSDSFAVVLNIRPAGLGHKGTSWEHADENEAVFLKSHGWPHVACLKYISRHDAPYRRRQVVLPEVPKSTPRYLGRTGVDKDEASARALDEPDCT